MFEGSAITMLSSLDTVSSLSEDTLLWPGRKPFCVYSVVARFMQGHTSRSLSGVYGDVSNSSMGMGVIIFCLLAGWLSLRSWVCRGEPTVCSWGRAAQHCQGKQVPVGAAAARPKALHSENDALFFFSQPQAGFLLSRTRHHFVLGFSKCVIVVHWFSVCCVYQGFPEPVWTIYMK